MYTLYYDKEKAEIQVTKAKTAMQKPSYYTDEVTYYNNHYYTCLKRKPLVEKAKEMKQEWIDETEKLLEKYKDISI